MTVVWFWVAKIKKEEVTGVRFFKTAFFHKRSLSCRKKRYTSCLVLLSDSLFPEPPRPLKPLPLLIVWSLLPIASIQALVSTSRVHSFLKMFSIRTYHQNSLLHQVMFSNSNCSLSLSLLHLWSRSKYAITGVVLCFIIIMYTSLFSLSKGYQIKTPAIGYADMLVKMESCSQKPTNQLAHFSLRRRKLVRT